MSKIAAVGRRHFVGSFAAIGAATVPASTSAEFDQACRTLGTEQTPALVLVDQHFADREDAVEALRQSGAAVLLLAAEPSDRHPALDSMRTLIELAAGANILGEY